MKKLIGITLTFLLILISTQVRAGCPENDFIEGVLTPVVFSFEKRDGTGEDTANTSNKKIALSYWNGSAWKWVDTADDLWDDSTETQLAMTQLTGSQYYFNIPATTLSATVSGKYVTLRFDETDDVDVTVSCVVYVQPQNRLVDDEALGSSGKTTDDTKDVVDRIRR